MRFCRRSGVQVDEGGAVLHEQIQASTSLCMLFGEVEATREGDVRESPASLGVLISSRVTGTVSLLEVRMP